MLLVKTTTETSFSGVMSKTEIERNEVGTQQFFQFELKTDGILIDI